MFVHHRVLLPCSFVGVRGVEVSEYLCSYRQLLKIGYWKSLCLVMAILWIQVFLLCIRVFIHDHGWMSKNSNSDYTLWKVRVRARVLSIVSLVHLAQSGWWNGRWCKKWQIIGEADKGVFPPSTFTQMENAAALSFIVHVNRSFNRFAHQAHHQFAPLDPCHSRTVARNQLPVLQHRNWQHKYR